MRSANRGDAPVGARDYTRKQFVGRGVAAAAALFGAADLLAACGSSKPSAAKGATAAGESKDVTLLNWHTSTPKEGLGEGYVAAGKAYEAANAGATVGFQAEPIADYVPFVTSAARAGKLPSNIALYPGLNHVALFPAVEPLTQAEAGGLFNEVSGWLDTELKVGESGTYAGLPFGGQGILWYFNKKLFKQAGLDPTKPPATFDEFASICEALKSKGIAPIGISGSDSFTPWWMFGSWLTQSFPTEQAVREFATGGLKFNEPRVKTVLSTLEETYKRGWWAPGYKSKAFTDVESDFAKGKVAMVCGVITDIMNWAIWDTKLGKEAYGVFPAPVIAGGKVSSPIMFFYPSILLAVTKGTKNKESALAFNKFLTSKQGQTIVLENGGSFPNRTDIDVETATKSPGATKINSLLKSHTTVDSILTWLNSAASPKALSLVTSAVTSGGLSGYMNEIATLQSQS